MYNFLYIRLLTTKVSHKTPRRYASNHAAACFRKFFMPQYSKKRHNWYEPKFKTIEDIAQPRISGEGTSRRLNVLNTVFMYNITDLLTTGEFGNKLQGYGLEITKVKVLQHLSGINVFWRCSKIEKEKEVNDVLASLAYPIRHNLSELRILGHVPVLTFVKDKKHDLYIEIEKRLTEAALDNNFERNDDDENNISGSLPSPINAVRYAIMRATNNNDQWLIKYQFSEEEIKEIYSSVPQMLGSVFGVQRDRIYNKIYHNYVKQKAEHRKSDSSSTEYYCDKPTPQSIEIKKWVKQYIKNKKIVARNDSLVDEGIDYDVCANCVVPTMNVLDDIWEEDVHNLNT